MMLWLCTQARSLSTQAATRSDDTKELSVIKGMVPSFDDMPAGCAFCPRCPQAREICRQKMPELVEAEGRKVRCFKYTKEWEENI